MASLNATIQDRAISHQIGILRRGSSIRNRLIKHLSSVEDDLVTQIINRGSKGDFTEARLEFMLRDVRGLLDEARSNSLEIVRGELKELAVWEAEFNRKLISGSSPVQLNLLMPSEAQLKAAVTSQPFRGKFLKDWVGELHRSTRERLSSTIRIGFTEGQTIPQVVRTIRSEGLFGTTRNHAEALVRTATNHVASSSRSELFKANEDIIKKEVYVATLDSNTTPICQSLDGTVIDVGGHPRPPQHVGCRSSTAPVTKSYRELGLDIDEVSEGTRASMDGQVPAKTTYQDWLKRQDKETQEDALGKTKARLFRQGNLSVDKFVDSRGNTLTLKQLKDRDNKAFKRAGIDPDEV